MGHREPGHLRIYYEAAYVVSKKMLVYMKKFRLFFFLIALFCTSCGIIDTGSAEQTEALLTGTFRTGIAYDFVGWSVCGTCERRGA